MSGIDTLARSKLERAEQWREIVDKVPPLNFPSTWGVSIIPPFCGAVGRFVVWKGSARVSVYLDWYGNLGAVDEPYWECHPDARGDDVARFTLDQGPQLIAEIRKSLARQARLSRASGQGE